MPTSSDMTTHTDPALLDALQHQVAVFARRAEQSRLGGVGQARNSMDRAAYLLLNRLDQEGPMGVKALAAGWASTPRRSPGRSPRWSTPGWSAAPRTPRTAGPWCSSCPSAAAPAWKRCATSRRALMALVTEEWTEEERDAFCTLLTRFNSSLADITASLPPAAPTS